jgi:hypothetical protein
LKRLRGLLPVGEDVNALAFLIKLFICRMNVLEKRRCFSHKTFLGAGENAVCTALEHKKYGKCGPGKVMRENSPFLTLNICNAAKSIMRKWKSILRNDSYASYFFWNRWNRERFE